MDSLGVQLYAFAVTLIAGASIGFIFDLYRVLRSWLRPGTLATTVMDLFFWIVLTPVIMIYLLIANWGQLRFYVLIGVVLGLAFYRLLFSHVVVRSLISLAHFFGRIISFICQVTLALFVWPLRVFQDLALMLRARRRKQTDSNSRFNWRWRSGLRWQSSRLFLFRRR